MKILFFLDPLVEGSLPEWKAGWVWAVRSMVLALRSAKAQPADGLQFTLVCSDLIRPTAISVLPECDVHAINQERLVPALGRSGLEIAVGWSEESCNSGQLQMMAAHVAAACPNGSPDICITFSPAPFLRVAFPDCPIIHRENGMLSVPPFVSTTYLDPAGMQKRSILTQHADEIVGYQPESSEKDLVDLVRNHYRQRLFGDKNPLQEWANANFGAYSRGVLLSLQAECFYSYVGYAQFPDQYDLLMHVLHSVPQDVAVVCTEHPRFPALPESTIRFLQRKYPNLLWDPVLRNIDGSSQHLMEYVDTVITVSSSIGFQTLLWNKRLIVAGSSQLDIIAHSHDVRDAAIVHEIDAAAADGVLAWLLTHYFLPTSLIHDGDFLMTRLAHEIKCKSDAPIRHLPPAADVETLKLAHLKLDVKNDLSFLGTFDSTPPVNVVMFTAVPDEGFSDETCFTYRVSIRSDPQRIRLSFPTNGRNINRLRIDLSDRQDLFETRSISVTANNNETLWSWTTDEPFPRSVSGILATELDGRTLLTCLDDDPQLHVELSPSSAAWQSITVELDINRANPLIRLAESEASVCKLEDEKRTQQNQLASEVGLARANFVDFSRERARWRTEKEKLLGELANMSTNVELLKNSLSAKDEDLEAVRGSLTWRATAPFREIRNAYKNKPHRGPNTDAPD